MPPVHRIAVLGLVNAYLVEEDDGLTLVDTMLPRCAGRILKAAGEHPIKRMPMGHGGIAFVHAIGIDQRTGKLSGGADTGAAGMAIEVA